MDGDKEVLWECINGTEYWNAIHQIDHKPNMEEYLKSEPTVIWSLVADVVAFPEYFSLYIIQNIVPTYYWHYCETRSTKLC